MKKSSVVFLNKLPTGTKLAEILGKKPQKFLVIYDAKLEKNLEFKAWLTKFSYVYKVKAGESLKSLESFPSHIKKIFRLITPFSPRSVCVVAVGGGSIGDFAGFAASVIKRGIPLIHLPTTLLAAMDSAHGGKTALNISGFKNQVGSFYPAESILLFRSFFQSLPSSQIRSAYGEFAKMAFIQGDPLIKTLRGSDQLDLEFLWSHLTEVIEEKWRWVAKDPYEESNHRQVLNLGHSFGHVLESYFGLPHGLAVGQGLIFAVQWSHHRGYMSLTTKESLVQLLTSRLNFLAPEDFVKKYKKLSASRLLKFIAEDKKMTDSRRLNFVFLEKPGIPFVKKVSIHSFVTETQRQGWTQI